MHFLKHFIEITAFIANKYGEVKALDCEPVIRIYVPQWWNQFSECHTQVRHPMAAGGFGSPSRTHPPRGLRPRSAAPRSLASRSHAKRDPPRFLADRRPWTATPKKWNADFKDLNHKRSLIPNLCQQVTGSNLKTMSLYTCGLYDTHQNVRFKAYQSSAFAVISTVLHRVPASCQ